MLVVISYDVSTKSPAGAQRLRRIAQLCLNYGLRVQNSVFECNVSEAEWKELRARLLEEYDPREDSLRFYFLGLNWKRRVEHHGAKVVADIESPMIF
ncbi:MAG: CRISPR-associated endonuclease Cas2 [Bacteroidota bacterium]|nr:CRISPR-associated endonuclease Cas2 [Candidatus Kapabacteria bacterium]MCS7303373.1 CRISPR-associated endonuclease Cas2 [Candidatus Kapabacteria bacterium]MCX7937765.1 CRISPR-associated endonuclease Cas2 [Chlorobiota bacterium]MDW8075949.1 CRISPR-associated endonuclease Cas2 [Bacteroidota bacterium]MDW8272543.1 CRISPR-associated endonuclease Cas2 [Bacteroidota bacterium]